MVRHPATACSPTRHVGMQQVQLVGMFLDLKRQHVQSYDLESHLGVSFVRLPIFVFLEQHTKRKTYHLRGAPIPNRGATHLAPLRSGAANAAAANALPLPALRSSLASSGEPFGEAARHRRDKRKGIWGQQISTRQGAGVCWM